MQKKLQNNLFEHIYIIKRMKSYSEIRCFIKGQLNLHILYLQKFSF